jgi:hypothetical protein
MIHAFALIGWDAIPVSRVLGARRGKSVDSPMGDRGRR